MSNDFIVMACLTLNYINFDSFALAIHCYYSKTCESVKLKLNTTTTTYVHIYN
ncbi:hypothetical protein C0J52_15901 [Blattella germanica]|nr:hypothetical protein C0J52_15901 [Blattella germanica]